LTSSRDQQIRALYRAALERPANERASFVAELSGGDEQLRRSVELMLSQQGATDVGAGGADSADEQDELAPGTQIGNYRIERVQGRGGMGVVYRATDTKLHRPVAIKFLSIAVADEQAIRRFRQEATTTSSLNHPHIVTVYDVGEHAGHEFIVSELVDGGTLDDWSTANRRRTWRQSVELLTGVADGIAAAHAAGVLHRDIKPGNVLVGSSGYAKLADFGLAKLVHRDSDATRGLAAGPSNTRAGVVIGTIAYMSPEQAAGQPLDARSDIFSFGIVLYELLAGRRPFEAANDLELLKTIVHGTPSPLPETVPELLRMAVDKALEKERADRYQTMGDLVADLRRVARKSASAQSALPTSSDVQVAAALVKRRPGAVFAVAAALVAAVVGGTYMALPRFAPLTSTPPAPGRSRAYDITQLTTTGSAFTPAISPDGRYVVYAQFDAGSPLSSLWVRQTATASNVQIVPLEPGIGMYAPTVTPDGNFVDFVRVVIDGDVSLWRVPFLGGTPRRLIENVVSPVGWSPDGRLMAFLRNDDQTTSLVVTDADGNERVLATRHRPAYFVNLSTAGNPPVRPAWSPDGHVIALIEYTDLQTARVVFVDVATGAETSVDSRGSFGAQGLAWLGPTSLVLSEPEEFGQRVQLWQMSYPDGAVVPLTNDLTSYLGVDVDASRGSLVTSRQDTRATLWVGDAAGANGTEIVPSTPFGGANVLVAWAGDRLLYDAMMNGHASIAGIAPGRGPPEEVVANAFHVAATSKGDTIVFVRSARGADGLWKVDATGQRPKRLVTTFAVEPLVTPDDRHVVYISPRSGIESPWIVPLDGGDATQIVNESAGSFAISPDGRRLTFISNGSGKSILVVCDLPECSNRRDLDAPHGSYGSGLRWTPDGQAIAFVGPSGLNIWALPLDGGPERAITHFGTGTAGATIARFAWSRDGQRLAIVRMTIADDIVLLRGLRP